jgi:hypothetical protein
VVIVDQYDGVLLQGLKYHPKKCVLERHRVALLTRLHEVSNAKKPPAEDPVQMGQDRRPAPTRPAPAMKQVANLMGLREPVGRLPLNRAQSCIWLLNHSLGVS